MMFVTHNYPKPPHFWATVCKTVHPMLSDRCLSSLPVCPVCLLSETNGWMDQHMKLGTEVGLVPGHIVLDGDPAHPAQKGHSSPNLWHMSVKTKWLDGSRCHLACRQPRSRPHCVTWGPSFSQKGHIPQFSANVCCGETAGCVMGTQPPPQGAQQPPLFGPCLLWPNRSMDQDATWCGGRPRPRRHCAQLIPLFL